MSALPLSALNAKEKKLMRILSAFVDVYQFLQKQVHMRLLKHFLNGDEILREIPSLYNVRSSLLFP
jgi:hypothetical protein